MARIAGRFDHCLAELERQSANPDEGTPMYVLIDTTNNAAIAKSPDYGALAGLSVVQYANVDACIVGLYYNRDFAQFDFKQVIGIGAGIGLDLGESTIEYADLLRQVREGILAAEHLLFPFTAAQLARQVFAIGAADDKPRYFNPDGDEPLPAKQWHVGPQRNRKREDASYWVTFATGEAGGAGEVAAPKPRPSARKAAAPAQGGTPAAPKQRPTPSGPATRPKAGTSTGKVWDIADELYATTVAGQGKDLKTLRADVMARCEAEGINPSTASVQFGKWKASQ